MIVTISGHAGSGKSTVAKELAKKLEYKHYSNGDFMRQMAVERDVTLIELSRMAETDKSIDKEIDDRQIKIGKEEDNFIIDSRLGWHFMPDAVKIFLTVDAEVAYNRIYSDKSDKRDVEKISDKDKLISEILERRKSENKRYKEYYGIDQEDLSNYDLLIDTSEMTVEQIVENILAFLKKRLNNSCLK